MEEGVMREPDWQSDDGQIQLHCCDCLPLLAEIPSGGVDCVLTDPPYGIGEHGGACRTRGRPGYAKHEDFGWDNAAPPAIAFDEMIRVSAQQIIWGGNYFADKLPVTQGWLYWRKLMGGDFADGELAWTSLGKALREFTKCPKGMDKQHPCEKPLSLMMWCLSFVPNAETILDPYAGVGTTGVACIRTGRRFIGCELEPRYFEIAVKRIERALAEDRASLFPARPRETQPKLNMEEA